MRYMPVSSLYLFFLPRSSNMCWGYLIFDQVIIVTSSLMKDMNSRIDLYRSNAIRVLCNITDAGLLGQIERYLKQAVVDKSAAVSSAALVSGMHLLEARVPFLWKNVHNLKYCTGERRNSATLEQWSSRGRKFKIPCCAIPRPGTSPQNSESR